MSGCAKMPVALWSMVETDKWEFIEPIRSALLSSKIQFIVQNNRMCQMEEINGCNLLNTKRDGRMPSEFTSSYHVHVIVRQGQMRFSDGKQTYVSQKDDLVIWQMSNTIQEVVYSADFEADFLIASGDFLSRFNPEMVWASKGFIFIRINPSFHLHEESLRLMNDDFTLFRSRLDQPQTPFKEEVIGRVMQIFLYDLWTVYSQEMVADGNDRQCCPHLPAFPLAGAARLPTSARRDLLC